MLKIPLAFQSRFLAFSIRSCWYMLELHDECIIESYCGFYQTDFQLLSSFGTVLFLLFQHLIKVLQHNLLT